MRIHVIIFHNIETNPEVIKHLIGVNWKRFSISVLKSCLRTLHPARDSVLSLSLSQPRPASAAFLVCSGGVCSKCKNSNKLYSHGKYFNTGLSTILVSYQFCFEGRHINIKSLTLNCEPWSITIKCMQETRDSKSSFLKWGFTLSPKKVIFCIHHE